MRRTSTCWLTIVEQPEESEIVTHSGMPSGIAATVKVMATRIMYTHPAVSGLFGSLVWSANPTMKTMIQTMIARAPMTMPSLCKDACKGVMVAAAFGSHFPQRPGFSFPANSAAMLPTRVRMPVATTTPRALPLFTLQPEKTMVSGVSLPLWVLFGFAAFATSSDSPVKGISSTLRSSASSRRMSAGTTSPTPRMTMSPRTMALLLTCSSTPSRHTMASGCDILESASSALPA
mmetsp:Transcript_27811/g.57617  ORF Transcript_27811/g.57617 Transcript_27811/m.57617 type:complete len:233 (+) Transcript_27811:875-1573(+)